MKVAVLPDTSHYVFIPDLCFIAGGRDAVMVAQGCFSRQKTNLRVRTGRIALCSGSKQGPS